MSSGRYTFHGLLVSSRNAPRWLCVESGSNRRLVLASVEASRIARLESAKGITHRHLAAIIDVSKSAEGVEAPPGLELANGGGVAIAEYVPGRTLHQHLAGKPMSPAKAVAWVLRLVDALQALHARGAVHGAISPWSVLAEPEGRAIPPVLSTLVAPVIGAYCAPERLKGAVESAADDVWGLHATLYTALTGHAPFAASNRDELIKAMLAAKLKPLKDFGVDEPALSEILERGLAPERRNRVLDLGEFSKTLDGWEREPRAMPPRRVLLPRPAPRALMDIVHGTGPGATREDGIIVDLAGVLDDEGQVKPPPTPRRAQPPPLPVEPRPVAIANVPPAVSKPAQAPPAPHLSPSATPLSLVELAREIPAVVTVQPPPRATPTGSRRLSFNPFERKRRVWPVALIAAAVSGVAVYAAVGRDSAPEAQAPAAPAAVVAPPKAVSKPKITPALQRDTCVRSHFAEQTFGAETPSFEFVCADGDFRTISQKLFEQVKASAETNGQVVQPLGWYELAATSIIRKSCCSGTPPVILPETLGWCEQLQAAVRRIADDSAKAGDLAPAARNFDRAVSCLFANRIPRPYTYDRPSTPASRKAFEQFLSQAAISEARR